jgi:hypothetical protein
MRVGAVLLIATAGAISCAQFAIGADPFVVIVACLTVGVGVAPLFAGKRDLYTAFPVLVMLQYVGIAFALKTLYGQALDSNLKYPLEAYILALVIVSCTAGVSVVARLLDRGGSKIPSAASLPALRTVSTIAALAGGGAQVLAIFTRGKDLGFTAGPLYVVAATLAHLFELGITCEIAYSVSKNPRNPISSRLVFMIGASAILAISSNERVFVVNSLIAAALMLAFFNGLRARTIVVGIFGLVFATSVLSPVMLSLRSIRDGKTPVEFMRLGTERITRAITDPSYFSELSSRQRAYELLRGGRLAYDYYGDRSNLPNRMAYVALLDAAYAGTKNHELIGADAVAAEVFSRSVPSFIVRDKQVKTYQFGDWLSWRMGMSDLGNVYSANFGLPMEGLATFGLLGLVLYPWLFILPALVVTGWLSSFRAPRPTSVFLFSALLNTIMEGQTDSYISIYLRVLPTLGLAAWTIYTFANAHSQLSADHAPTVAGRPA